MHIVNKIIGRSKRRRVITLVLATMAISGAAFAAWALSGSGSSGGTVGSPTNLTANAVSASNSVYPGGLGDAAFTITNPNGFPVVVTEADLSNLHLPGACSAGDVTIAQAAFTGLSVTIPAHSTSAEVDLPGAFAGASDISASCVGVGFTSDIALVAHSG